MTVTINSLSYIYTVVVSGPGPSQIDYETFFDQ